jgi:prepilin-type processing-associated H-X9-DG protein
VLGWAWRRKAEGGPEGIAVDEALLLAWVALGGSNFAFADGCVRFLSDQTELVALRALSTRAGREVVSVP